MSNIFFYTICIGFANGIFFRSLFHFGENAMMLLLVISLTCAFVWRIKVRSFDSPLFLCSLFLLVCALGMFRMDVADRKVSDLSVYIGNDVELVGKVMREPEIRTDTVHLHVVPIIDGVYADEYVLATVDRFAYAEQNIEYGDTVRVRGELTLPEAFETDTGRMFDYPQYLRTKGINLVMYDAESTIEVIGEDSFLRRLYATKHRFMESIERALPQPHAGLGEGLLLGVKRALGDTLDEAFRKTGIIHIVVLSGYNILIVVEAMLYVLAYVCRPRMRMVVGVLGIATFALLVGMSATVVRASIMAGLLLIARGTGRSYAVLRGLGLAGVVMLCINPHLLVHDPGFQLSFLATLGLILFVPYIEKKLSFIPDMRGIRGIASATIATQIIVLPLLLYHTGMFSVVSIVVNMLVLPMVPVAMFLTFTTGILGLVSVSLGTLVGYATYLSLSYIIEIAVWFASIPLSATTVEIFPFWVVLIAYFLLGLWYTTTMRDSDGVEVADDTPIHNDYEGWVIEEENEVNKKPAEAQSASAGNKSPLPFR